MSVVNAPSTQMSLDRIGMRPVNRESPYLDVHLAL